MHDLNKNSTRYAIASAGVVASLCMLMVSAYLNAVFLARLGKTPMDAYVYGSAGIAIDVFMALCPFFYLSAFKNREWLRGSFALVLWVALTAFSAQSAIGHLASSRGDAASNREVASDTYKQTQDDLKRLRAELAWKTKPPEAADSLRAKIKGHQGQLLWQQTSECANQWTAAAKQFCIKFTDLTAALGNAIEFKKIEDKIDELQKKAENVAAHNAGVASDADQGASTISKLLGLSVKDTQSLLNLLGAMVLLLGAGLGPFVSMSVVANMDAKAARPGDDAKVIDAVVVPQPLLLATEQGKPLDLQIKQAAQLIAPGKDLTQEARELLLAIGMPTKVCDKRPQDDRSVVAWRFMAYLAAYGYKGDFTAEEVDTLYDRFTREDNREPSGLRVVKADLIMLAPQCAWKSTPRDDDGQRKTVWTIKPPSITRLTEILRRKGIASALPPPSPSPQAPEPTPAQEPPKNVFSLFGPKKAS